MEEEYQVTVRTSLAPSAGTYNRVLVTLIGTQNESPTVSVGDITQMLTPGSEHTFRLRADVPFGHVVLVRLRLERRPGFPDLDWHCQWVDVARLGHPGTRQSAERFHCDKWLRTADGDVELRNGQICILNAESLDILKNHRAQQLQNRQQIYRWCVFAKGIPSCVDLSSLKHLGPNLSYTRQSPGVNLHYLRGFADRAMSWSSLEELEVLFSHTVQGNAVAKFVQAHWKEDSFFGYQCLNGCNPLMLRRVQRVPPNMAVNADMLQPFLSEGSSLELEMEKGTIFLLDYEVLEGVPSNIINGKQQYLSAPLCLLHCDHQGVLKPIAIQLQQTPGHQNPVFIPSDPEPDWLLAKIWVRCADFQCHQLISHFLHTHLLGEVCCIATLRQLPEMHPVYQVLMPHIRTTLQINIQARASLLAPGGVFDKSVGCGLEGIAVLLQRATERLQYRTLCVPDDLEDRGVAALPNSHYAQDALKVWAALHRFASDWVDLYYTSDSEIHQDKELQNWIQDIFSEGFLGLTHTGLPQYFQTKTELSKFITMVIFSCTALHAAVNFSQLDFNLWMPNCPATMCRPPPLAKGLVTMQDLFSSLPDVNATCSVLTTLSLLSQPGKDFIPLCQYHEECFRSGTPQQLVEALQNELRSISVYIAERNRFLELPYPYLDPDQIENSVAI